MTVSNDVLLERVTAAVRAIEEHRQEARESTAEIRAALHELAELKPRVERLEARDEDMHATVHGTKDGPGLKGRVDAGERTVGIMVWAVASGTVVLIAKAIDWVSSLGNPKAP